MADTQTQVSGTTIAPGDSASQVAAPTSKTDKPKSSGRQKRPSKNSKDKDAPQGAVQVQPGGQAKTGKATTPISQTIPLSGWGEIDLSSHRVQMEPEFVADAKPYEDLVVNVYQGIQSRYSSGGKHIPSGLFFYYCHTMWWYRALFLHRRNGQVLTTDQKNFMNTIEAGEEYHLPSHIAQYLSNMGNFMVGGETHLFRLPSHGLGNTADPQVPGGWFTSGVAGNRANGPMWHQYTQMPAPAAYVSYAMNEAYSTTPAPLPATYLDLSFGAPNTVPNAATYHATDNIIGWFNATWQASHSSWRSTYANLGWSIATPPPDVQTAYMVSTSTLRWVSDRLETLKDFKTFSSKQLSLSTQGNPIQAYWLDTEVEMANVDQRPPVANAGTNALNGTLNTQLGLLSRYSMDSKLLAPAYAFGYRIQRHPVCTGLNANQQPVWANRSNHDPWIMTNAAGDTYIDPPAAWMADLNSTFTHGSQPSTLNTRRFATHALLRSVALDTAVVLSDMK